VTFGKLSGENQTKPEISGNDDRKTTSGFQNLERRERRKREEGEGERRHGNPVKDGRNTGTTTQKLYVNLK
jgi:helix-turn-helix protein